MEVLINDKFNLFLNHTSGAELRCFLQNALGLKSEDYYLISNGKLIDQCSDIEFNKVNVILRVRGGKGGFGSMLRAIGAQIEKTTNREACRDLSGRRLRDINEEQRLKTWINQQAEREKEAKEKRQKKLERLCETPRHEFKDEQYDKERSELPEIVEDALLQGLQASCSSKRKAVDEKPVVKKKKTKLWMDDELEDDLSSEDEGCDSGDNKSSPASNTIPEADQSNSSECTSDNKITENGVNTQNQEKSGEKIVANAGNDDSKDTKDLEPSEKNRESDGMEETTKQLRIEETVEKC